jgi:hypothetical protein
MITNALIVSFVTSFIAIAVFGHVLLFAAIWPQLSLKRRQAQPDAVDTTAQSATASN